MDLWCSHCGSRALNLYRHGRLPSGHNTWDYQCHACGMWVRVYDATQPLADHHAQNINRGLRRKERIRK